jgi:hypothetical protein
MIHVFGGDSDFSEWIRKVELVARLQKIGELEKFVPLFLTGGAFAVYESLEESVKDDYKELRTALLKAFSVSQFQAYEQFSTRRLIPGEAVDVYLSDLRRLSKLVSSEPDEAWLKCAMVRGLPEDVKKQLTAACELERMDLTQILERARTLIGVNAALLVGAVSRVTVKESPPQGDNHQKKVLCYRCNKVGHLARNCPSDEGNERTREHAVVSCYNCGERGHISRFCPRSRKEVDRSQKLSKNE